MKIEEVAKSFNVDIRTVHSWIVQMKLDVLMIDNEYFFSDEMIQTISINLANNNINQKTTSSMTTNWLEQRLDLLEKRVDQKADDVISYQLLIQRKEIEELYQLVNDLKNEISSINRERTLKEETIIPIENLSRKKNKSKFKWLSS